MKVRFNNSVEEVTTFRIVKSAVLVEDEAEVEYGIFIGRDFEIEDEDGYDPVGYIKMDDNTKDSIQVTEKIAQSMLDEVYVSDCIDLSDNGKWAELIEWL